MNSIFFRIYAGMVAAILLIGGGAYGVVNLINHYRADVYREAMARGTFYLMAEGLERHKADDERKRWLAVLDRLLGSEVKLRGESSLDLSQDERKRLNQGLVAMRLNEGSGYADIIFKMPDEPQYIFTRMTKVGEKQARATALLILDELSQYPRGQWDKVFARMQKHFGYPISRMPESALELDNEQMQRLQRREVVLAFDENSSRAGSSVNVYAPMGSTGQVLVMGPLSLFDRWPIEMLVIVGVAGLLAMALATYLLVRPLQGRLYKLDRAVQQVGAGNLAARAEVRGSDAVGKLASTLNGMTEHIRRLIESQREMTRAVSHELRTPVARLRFGLEMLADSESANVRREKLSELDADIDQLDSLIDEILTFARLEEGTPTLEFRPVHIPRLLEQVRRELLPISGGVDIQVDTRDLAPENSYAEGEDKYLHRILQNLVTNAVRYGNGQVAMRYRVQNDMAILEVEDNGPGIPEAERQRVFKPFARMDSSRHRASGGYGLGLSIVQRIVEWHGGRVEVDRGALGGALFRVTWPRQRAGHHVLGQ